MLNLKANNNDVSQAIDNIYNSIENRPTFSEINELNNEKISKNEIMYYLNSKPSYEDIENKLKEKIDKREFNNKYEELLHNFEIFKKEIYDKIGNYVLYSDYTNFQKKIEKEENLNNVEIKNILDKKADKESVYNSLKLKVDKNEINTILCNKLDKSDLAIIIKALGEKLNKNDFFKYKEWIEKGNNNIFDYNNIIDNNLNIANDVKQINKEVQDMKEIINKRIDIINTDNERLLENIKNKFESMNIAINNINKKEKGNESYQNILNSLKKKIDIEKFDSFIKKIKINLEHNFIEITKNTNQKIEELIENKIKIINKNFSDNLEKQNSMINNYISDNKNELSQYQIRVQGIINKIDTENKLNIAKIKNEFIEKIDEKLITDKFYNLIEDTKNKNNINQISPEKKILNNNNNSLINSNEKENKNYKDEDDIIDIKEDNKLNKNIKNENDIKEINDKISQIQNEINDKFKEIQNEIIKNKNEFSNAMNSQALINETLCNENKIGRWIWDGGKLKNNYNIIWDIQKINTSPDNYILEKDKSIIIIKEEGYYEITLGIFGYSKKPNIQILVDNEVVISNANKNMNNNSINQICSNTIYSGFMKLGIKNLGNGSFRNATGLTIIDFIFFRNNAKLSVFFSGDIGKGFLGLKKI